MKSSWCLPSDGRDMVGMLLVIGNVQITYCMFNVPVISIVKLRSKVKKLVSAVKLQILTAWGHGRIVSAKNFKWAEE